MSFEEADLDLITDACFETKARDMSLEDCPFCDKCPSMDFPPEHWIQHVAQHLFKFARISLQGYLEEDDEESDISGSQSEKGSTSHQFISPTITDGLLDQSFENEDYEADHLNRLDSKYETLDTGHVVWSDYFGLLQEPKGSLPTDPILQVFIARAEELGKNQGSSRIIAEGSSSFSVRQPVPLVQDWPMFSQTLRKVITTEIVYLHKIEIFQSIYQTRLSQSTNEPPRLRKFISDVLKNLDDVKMVNETNMLLPLRNRQEMQQASVVEIAEIFLTWNSMANSIYTDYILRFPRAIHVVRSEADRNSDFRAFLDKIHWTHDFDAYLDLPLARMQEYKSLLSTFSPIPFENDYQKSRVVSAVKAVNLAVLQYENSMKQARMIFGLLEEFGGEIPEELRFILVSLVRQSLIYKTRRGSLTSSRLKIPSRKWL
ncbi:Rho guanyl nucleotide exchange factor [Penicillium verhagenii]|uniref:Rho guanyl nucleotide exchange factor n=1 Tax=Penicillium verhagenii TaxID=1562060 RepID=UPI0025453ACC|nr:Rho guanyl nucleotide exchange factor [Penicillium verhagenii]KAJ5915594.1 Rho guanyl nucleotide exchange factor [Penicillium verhagenii]